MSHPFARRGRRSSVALALLTAILVLVPVALAVPGAPQYRLIAADNKLAAQLVLKKTDLLPVYHADPTRFAAGRVYRCPGLYMPDRSRVIVTGSAEHVYTNGGSNGIGSSGAVFKTAADLDLYWRETIRPAYAKCLAIGYTKSARKDLKVKIVFARPFDIGPTGVEKTAAFRIRLVYSDKTGASEVVERTIVFLGTGRLLAHLSFGDIEYRCDCPVPITRKIAYRMQLANRG